jgi:riboflavin synthase
MFSGIVERKARVVQVSPGGDGIRLELDVDTHPSLPEWKFRALGESISVSGVCLTVVESDGPRLAFDVVPETMGLTSLGSLAIDASVNIERSLSVGDLLGGHLVTGHVDATGTIVERRAEGKQDTFKVATDVRLIRQMLPKGSITVDGVSLTLVEVEREENWFSFAAIPHTLEITTLGERQPGNIVNLETDAIGKWVIHGLREIFSEQTPPLP